MSLPRSAFCNAEANLRAALVLLQQLQACGLRRLVLCPGSRSAPLAVAAGLMAERGLDLLTAVDERSAAFLAVGLGRADALPAAVVTTSGTAVANLLPAVVEADNGAVPLLLLSADRPERLKHCGANQTVCQERFLDCCCRRMLQGDGRGLAVMAETDLRGLAEQAWRGSLAAPAGPVHLNLPFEEPLHAEPAALASAVSALCPVPSDAPAAELTAHLTAELAAHAMADRVADPLGGRAAQPPAEAVAEVGLSGPLPVASACSPPLAAGQDVSPPAWLDPDRAGVVVAGPWRGSAAQLETFAQSLRRWQRRSGWPVLADALSGLRGRPGLELVHSYDLLLADGHNLAPPGQLLRLGPMPASRRLQQWIAAAAGVQLLISEADPRNLDASGSATARWGNGLTAWLDTLPPGTLEGRPSMASRQRAERWLDLDARVQRDLDAALALPAAGFAEPSVARQLSRALPADLPLMLASSSPVRDWESFAAADAPARPIFSFRGASGIDGTLSLAAGLACSLGRLLLISGDLALLHDANGWLWRRQLEARGARLCVLVIENGGGGIFEQLPIRMAGSPEPMDFERLFAMPQAIDHTRLAAGYGVPARSVEAPEALPSLLAWGLEQPMALLQVRTDRRHDAELRHQLRRRMATVSAQA